MNIKPKRTVKEMQAILLEWAKEASFKKIYSSSDDLIKTAEDVFEVPLQERLLDKDK